MEHTAGQPETPEEPALWERPLPWLRETEPTSGQGDASEEEPVSPSEDGSAPDGVSTPDGTPATGTASDPAPGTEETSSAPGTLFRPRTRRSDDPTPASAPASSPAAEPAAPGGLFRPRAARPDSPTPAPASPTAPEPAAPGGLFRPRAARPAEPAPASASVATTAAEPSAEEVSAAPGSLFRPRTTGSGDSGGQRGAGAGDVRPERSARVVGVAVAGCALLVIGIGSAAFISMPNHDDSGPRAASVGDGVVPQLTAGGSVGQTGSPSGSGRPTHRTKGAKAGTDKGPHAEGSSSPVADAAHPDKASGTKAAHAADADAQSGTGSGSTTTKTPTSKPAAAGAAGAAGDELVGYGSSKCIEVSAHSGVDGSPLRLWGCDGDAWQKWVFKSDGSVRSMGLCLDIANASESDGAAIQLATCNGGWAQRFNLNGSHDLVNTVIGKCVDAKDSGTGNGTRLQLWSCGGTSNQKWHLG
ncbi:ricin-type beta-trefoil lectin domain protein [Streptomyces sp. NPDC086082]|uniref:ricin-type beta-trefoil lectin domain protein n=1 Tax=Streptomyces sp. NPDC086082 TaxID=3365750 RepID=UPI00381F8AD1